MLTIAPLAPVPAARIDALLDQAFGADRRTRTAYRLREGATAIPELSFSAHDGARLLGTLQSWPLALDTGSGRTPLVMVGPVAVEPAAQGTGVGRALMLALTAAADRLRTPALVMIGDPEYYERFGFRAAPAAGWRIDGPYEQRRLLARVRADMPETGRLVPARAPAMV